MPALLNVLLVHGVSLQRSMNRMLQCTDDTYTLEPLTKSVRYFSADTHRSVEDFAEKFEKQVNTYSCIWRYGGLPASSAFLLPNSAM